MTLRDYIKGRNRPEFAAKIGISGGALRKYIYGERIPRASVQERIREATDGAVTPADWHRLALEKEAA